MSGGRGADLSSAKPAAHVGKRVQFTVPALGKSSSLRFS